jgi:hypothetical protein
LFVLVGASARAQDTLPFRRVEPHPELRRLLAIKGTYTVRSVLVDAEGKQLNERRFRAVAAHKVYGLVLAIDTFLEGAEESMQSSMIVRRDTALTDITVSANGFVEFWDRVEPREGEVVAFQLRGAARLVTDGPNGRPLRSAGCLGFPRGIRSRRPPAGHGGPIPPEHHRRHA